MIVEEKRATVEEQDATIKHKIDVTKEMNIKVNDVLYKMFYGEWIITSVIEGRTFSEDKVDDFIGRVIEYSADSIKVDGEEVLDAPAYAYGILPTDKYWQFIQGYSPKETFINEQSDYFVYVSVETWSKGFSEENYLYKHFFVVDDNTLILDAYDAFFVMERLEYMEGYYEGIETFQDYSW